MSDSFEDIFDKMFDDDEWVDGVADPVDTFTKLPFENTHSFDTVSVAERSTRGIAVSDIWNNSYIYWLYAEKFRSQSTPEAGILLDCLIDVNEYSQGHAVPFYKDTEKFREAITAHNKEYGERYEEALKLWPKLYREVFQFTTFMEPTQVAQILLLLQKDVTAPWVWEDVKNVVPDPTEVHPKFEKEHLEQRANRGYSDWDKLIFPTYIHWVLISSALFHGSDKSMGYPAAYSGKVSSWHLALQTFIEGLLYGTFLENPTPKQETIYDIAVGNMLEYFPDFWD